MADFQTDALHEPDLDTFNLCDQALQDIWVSILACILLGFSAVTSRIDLKPIEPINPKTLNL